MVLDSIHHNDLRSENVNLHVHRPFGRVGVLLTFGRNINIKDICLSFRGLLRGDRASPILNDKVSITNVAFELGNEDLGTKRKVRMSRNRDSRDGSFGRAVGYLISPLIISAIVCNTTIVFLNNILSR